MMGDDDLDVGEVAERLGEVLSLAADNHEVSGIYGWEIHGIDIGEITVITPTQRFRFTGCELVGDEE